MVNLAPVCKLWEQKVKKYYDYNWVTDELIADISWTKNGYYVEWGIITPKSWVHHRKKFDSTREVLKFVRSFE